MQPLFVGRPITSYKGPPHMGTVLVPRARETPLQKPFKRRATKTFWGMLAKKTRKHQKEGQEDQGIVMKTRGTPLVWSFPSPRQCSVPSGAYDLFFLCSRGTGLPSGVSWSSWRCGGSYAVQSLLALKKNSCPFRGPPTWAPSWCRARGGPQSKQNKNGGHIAYGLITLSLLCS